MGNLVFPLALFSTFVFLTLDFFSGFFIKDQEMDKFNSIISALPFNNSETKRFLKFCVVGLSGIGVNMFFLWIFTEHLKIFYLFASPIAIELSIINNFVLNDLWTWRDRRKNQRFVWVKRVLKYHISVTISAIFANIFLLWFFTEILNLYYLFSNLFGIGAGAFLNYFLNDRWTFKKEKT